MGVTIERYTGAPLLTNIRSDNVDRLHDRSNAAITTTYWILDIHSDGDHEQDLH